MGTALTRDAIFAAQDLKRDLTEVDVPEWGGAVFVRVMTGDERDHFESSFDAIKGKGLRAYIAVTCACDENGVSLFKAEDTGPLGEKSSAALDRVFEAAARVNKLLPKHVEEIAGKSDASPSSGSPSAAPRHLA